MQAVAHVLRHAFDAVEHVEDDFAEVQIGLREQVKIGLFAPQFADKTTIAGFGVYYRSDAFINGALHDVAVDIHLPLPPAELQFHQAGGIFAQRVKKGLQVFLIDFGECGVDGIVAEIEFLHFFEHVVAHVKKVVQGVFGFKTGFCHESSRMVACSLE